MKKIISSLVLSLFLSTQAFASPLAMTPEYTSYSEPEFNFEIQFSNTDNQLANTFNSLVDLSLSYSQTNKKEDAIISLFREEFTDNEIQFNIKNSGVLIETNQSSSSFENFLEGIQEHTPLLEEEKNDNTAYEFLFSELAFANINNKLIISDSTETIFLHEQEVSTSDISMAGSSILSIDGTFDETKLDYKISESNGMLVSEYSTTFDQDLSNFDLNSSEPLYNTIKAESPIAYVEITNLIDIMSIALGEDSDYFMEEIDWNFGSWLPSYKSILNKQMAFLVDQNETILPDFTYSLADLTLTEANEISTFITDEVIVEFDDSGNYLMDVKTINTDLTQVTLTATDTNAEADLLNLESFTFTYGLLDGNYVISTNPNIITASKTISQDADFANSTATEKTNVSSVAFINFGKISQSIDKYKNTIQKIDSSINESVDYETIKNVLSEMGIWSGYSYFDGNKLTEKSTFNIPANAISNFLKPTGSESIFDTMFPSSYSYTYSPFDDVPSDTWYSQAVSQAYMSNIIDTYDYESESFTYEFQPNKDITRGEFIQMIVSAYQLNYEEIDQYGSDIFSDVSSDSYYDYAIGVAYQNQIIKGDDNADTFRPEATLNRAEAVQILYNASPLLNGKTSTQNLFKDVKSDAWYANVVRVAAEEEIVKGINPEEFAPSKNLNKAEAVTLLIRLVNNEVRF